MWCDNFDLDLYKVIPAARDVLAPLAGVHLHTHASVHNGQMNHPACWNTNRGLAAFFGFQPAGIKPEAYWTNDAILACTFEEAIRDCWVHTYCLTIMAAGRFHAIWDSQLVTDEFWALMGHVRKYKPLTDEVAQQMREHVLTSLVTALHNFRIVMAICGVKV